MSSEPVSLRREGAVAIVTLNRPETGNAIDMPLAVRLLEVLTEVARDAAVRCVVLTGNGKLFCAGGDIVAMTAVGENVPQFLKKLADVLHASVELLTEMRKPFVVLVNGAAAGAGMSLAILGDFVLATRQSHFSAAYGGVGLTPDGGMSWLLPRLVGLRRAQDIILAGQRVSAEEAQAIGLITRMVEPENLMSDGMAIAERLANGPIEALSDARELLAVSHSNTLPAHLAIEAARISAAGIRLEAHEGLAAFSERRSANFRHQ